MTSDFAEALAIKALGWIAASDELMPLFLGSTGASVADLKAQATEPGFLASVLDFLMMDDTWVIAFCDAVDCAYTQPMMARQVLPGGDLPNWT